MFFHSVYGVIMKVARIVGVFTLAAIFVLLLISCQSQSGPEEQEAASAGGTREQTAEPEPESGQEPGGSEDSAERLKQQQERLYDAFAAFKKGEFETASQLYTVYLENAHETDAAEEIRNAFRRLITALIKSGDGDVEARLQPLYEKFDRLTRLPSVEEVQTEIKMAEQVFSFNSISNLKEKYEWHEMEGGLLYADVKEGDGEIVNSGDLISCYYTLWNSKGKELQSNKGSQPFTTVIDAGRLIRGWDMSVPGMKVGGVRRLIVPGELAYGGNPPDASIMPDETLVFELEVTNVVK